MNKLFYLIVLLIISSCSYAQVQKTNCACPTPNYSGHQTPDTIFHFTNENSIALCGYKYKQASTSKTLFSEFCLSVCGQDSILNSWDALLTCQTHMNNDTLIVEQLEVLPIGNNMEYQQTVWSTLRIYFSNDRVIHKFSINRNISKYSTQQIQIVLHEFEMATKGIDESKMILANKLFIAIISGDATARKDFKTFENNFGSFNGVYAEEYYYLVKLLKDWDTE